MAEGDEDGLDFLRGEGGETGVHPGEEGAAVVVHPEQFGKASDGGAQVGQRVEGQGDDGYAVRAGKAGEGLGLALGEEQVGSEGQDALAAWGKRAANPREGGGLGGPVGKIGHADHQMAGAKGEDDLGKGGGGADDAGRRGRRREGGRRGAATGQAAHDEQRCHNAGGSAPYGLPLLFRAHFRNHPGVATGFESNRKTERNHMRIHAYRALRPREDIVGQVASPPYDTLDTHEAAEMAAGNPMSFLHINHSEIDLPEGTGLYDQAVYDKALENFRKFRDEGWLVSEDRPLMYLYAQTMGEHHQTGLVCCAHIDDYIQNRIKKHEFTRKDKEDDRTKHTATLNANIGPVFLAYRGVPEIRAALAASKQKDPVYDFVDELKVRHQVWTVENTDEIIQLFAEKVPISYIADGHHRSASAVRVGSERREANPNHTGNEEYNWFLAVLFAAEDLQILPYNRVVQDLNGMTPEDFLLKIRALFTVEETTVTRPSNPRDIRMYLGGTWYALTWPAFESSNPVELLDVSKLQNTVLDPLLGIGDPRTSERIKFIGGIRGPEELVKLVDSGEFEVAFSMYPTTVDQLMAIADADQIMPPKSTWFEPKLRTGLLTHELS